jgi:hypothetical protein
MNSKAYRKKRVVAYFKTLTQYLPWRLSKSIRYLGQDNRPWAEIRPWDLPNAKRCWLTNSMEQKISWETNSRSATQEFTNILCDSKDYYPVYKSPHLFPVLSQMNPINTTPPYFCKIRVIIILTPTTNRTHFLSNQTRPVMWADTFIFWASCRRRLRVPTSGANA